MTEMCRFGAAELHVVAAFMGGMAAQVHHTSHYHTSYTPCVLFILVMLLTMHAVGHVLSGVLVLTAIVPLCTHSSTRM